MCCASYYQMQINFLSGNDFDKCFDDIIYFQLLH